MIRRYHFQLIENHIEWSLNIRWYILLVLVLILPLGIIKLMKFLAPFSAIANVCLFVGLGIILFKIMDDLPPLSERPFVAPIEKVPLFFATMLFGLEGIGTVSIFSFAFNFMCIYFLTLAYWINIFPSFVSTFFTIVEKLTRNRRYYTRIRRRYVQERHDLRFMPKMNFKP